MANCTKCSKSYEIIAFERSIAIARMEANSVKNKAIVYKYKGKYYGECFSCWRKAGKNGEPIAIVFPDNHI